MILSLSVLFGLIFGSFANVLIHRLPLGQSIVAPRSQCPNCQMSIPWYQNLPLVSYFLLRGRAACCGSKINIRYPIVESLVALLFATTAIQFGMSPILILHDWPFVFLCVVISFIDLKHRIIPDVLSLPGLIIGILTSTWVPGMDLASSLLGAGLGFSLFFGLSYFYARSTGKIGLGGGDVKLLAMLGAFLGWQGVFTTILVSSVLGSAVGILWGIYQKQAKLLQVSIPYGPFLIIGALFYYLVGNFFGDLFW